MSESDTKLIWITNYTKENQYDTSIIKPYLIKINDNSFILLWNNPDNGVDFVINPNNGVNYVMLDRNGRQVGKNRKTKFFFHDKLARKLYIFRYVGELCHMVIFVFLSIPF